MKKNILYIQPYASQVGGVDTVLLQLIEGLNKDIYSPIVVLPSYSPYVDKYEELGAKVIFERLAVFGKPTSWDYYFVNLRNLIMSIKALRNIVKKYKVDLIHSHKMELMGGNIVGKILGIPTVQTVHELPRRPLIAYKFVGFLNHIFNDKVIVLCERSKVVFEWGGLKSQKVEKIYNGIAIKENKIEHRNLREELNISNDCKLVVTVARLSPMKGIEYLLDAARIVKESRGDIKFLVVGDVAFEHEKEYKTRLMQIAKEYNLEDTVFFLGLRRDVPHILNNSDIFVLPSVYDIFPTVILEAMGKGLPIIATDVGGVPEMVREDTGVIVPPMNSEKLALAITDILNKDYKQMGKAGKELLESEFTQEQYVFRTENIYNELLTSRG